MTTCRLSGGMIPTRMVPLTCLSTALAVTSLADRNPQRPLQFGDAAAHCRWRDVHVLGRRRETAEVRRANDHLQPPNLVHGKNPAKNPRNRRDRTASMSNTHD